MDGEESLSIRLDQEALRRLGSIAESSGLKVEELVSGLLREVIEEMDKDAG